MAIKIRDKSRGAMFDIWSTWPHSKKRPPASQNPEKRQWCDGRKYFPVHPSHNRTRCPKCNRPLFLQEIHCVGGELSGYCIPPHKTKVKIPKRPSRQSSKRMGRKGRK